MNKVKLHESFNKFVKDIGISGIMLDFEDFLSLIKKTEAIQSSAVEVKWTPVCENSKWKLGDLLTSILTGKPHSFYNEKKKEEVLQYRRNMHVNFTLKNQIFQYFVMVFQNLHVFVSKHSNLYAKYGFKLEGYKFGDEDLWKIDRVTVSNQNTRFRIQEKVGKTSYLLNCVWAQKKPTSLEISNYVQGKESFVVFRTKERYENFLKVTMKMMEVDHTCETSDGVMRRKIVGVAKGRLKVTNIESKVFLVVYLSPSNKDTFHKLFDQPPTLTEQKFGHLMDVFMMEYRPGIEINLELGQYLTMKASRSSFSWQVDNMPFKNVPSLHPDKMYITNLAKCLADPQFKCVLTSTSDLGKFMRESVFREWSCLKGSENINDFHRGHSKVREVRMRSETASSSPGTADGTSRSSLPPMDHLITKFMGGTDRKKTFKADQYKGMRKSATKEAGKDLVKRSDLKKKLQSSISQVFKPCSSKSKSSPIKTFKPKSSSPRKPLTENTLQHSSQSSDLLPKTKEPTTEQNQSVNANADLQESFAQSEISKEPVTSTSNLLDNRAKSATEMVAKSIAQSEISKEAVTSTSNLFDNKVNSAAEMVTKSLDTREFPSTSQNVDAPVQLRSETNVESLETSNVQKSFNEPSNHENSQQIDKEQTQRETTKLGSIELSLYQGDSDEDSSSSSSEEDTETPHEELDIKEETPEFSYDELVASAKKRRLTVSICNGDEYDETIARIKKGTVTARSIIKRGLPFKVSDYQGYIADAYPAPKKVKYAEPIPVTKPTYQRIRKCHLCQEKFDTEDLLWAHFDANHSGLSLEEGTVFTNAKVSRPPVRKLSFSPQKVQKKWRCEKCKKFSSWYPEETKKHFEQCTSD